MSQACEGDLKLSLVSEASLAFPAVGGRPGPHLGICAVSVDEREGLARVEEFTL